MIKSAGKYARLCRNVMMMVLFIGLPGQLYSQQPGFKHLTAEDGLPSSTIYSIFQDRQGYIWFASDIGVSRYDGYSFARYTTADGLADNEIFDFYEDSKGRIWFLSYNGKISYYLNGKVYNSENMPSLSPLNFESYLTTIFEEPETGYIWISSYLGEVANYLPDGRSNRFLFKEELATICKIYPVTPSSIGVLASKGLFQVTFRNDKASVEKIDLNLKLPSINKSKAAIVSDGLVFSNGREHPEVYSYNFSTKKIDVLLIGEYSIKVNNVINNGDDVWIATQRGYTTFNRTSKLFSDKMLTDYSVSSLLKDSEGNLWIGTLGEGVFYQSQNIIYSFNPVVQKVNCLAKDDHGNVWFGSDNGELCKVIGGVVKSYPFLDEKIKPHVKIHNITFSKENIWISSSHGIIKLSRTGREFVGGMTREAFEYSDGTCWLLYRHFLLKIRREDFDKKKRRFDVLRREDIVGGLGGTDRPAYNEYIVLDKQVNSMWRGAGAELWVATDENLHVMNLDSGRVEKTIPIDSRVRVHSIKGFSNGNIVLATTGGGIEVISHEGKSLGKVMEEQGLSSNYCTSLEIDDQNTIWVGTNRGVNKIEGFPDNVRVISLDENDGLPHNEILDLLFNRDTIWMATKKGLSFLVNKSISSPATNSVVYVKEFSVNGNFFAVESNCVDDITLKYFQKDIAVSFVYLSFVSHKKIMYRYRLFPDDDWKYTPDTHLNFPSLSPARYQLQIEAKDKSGEWSQPTTINFEITSPFWDTAFFNVIMFIVSLLLVWGMTSYYFRRQRKRVMEENRLIMSEIRALRAQINPHFFFNVLNAIQGMMFKNDQETMYSYLGKFGKLVRQMLDHSDKNFITLQDEIESITNYLQLEQLRLNNRFNFSFEIEPGLDTGNIEIPIMMVQPFVENSVKHGFQHMNGEGRLIVHLEQDAGYLNIKIIDNGIGRRRSQEFRTPSHESKGTDLIKRRIDVLNYKKRRKIELIIEDLPDDAGTCVVLKIPME